jgi:hypothetical protein
MSAQPLNSAPANSKPGDWYNVLSYDMAWLAMNMISSSHGLHMKMIFCDVYLLPNRGRIGPMSVGYWLLRSLGLMGELSI